VVLNTIRASIWGKANTVVTTSERVKGMWEFALKRFENGEYDGDLVAELVEETVNAITVLERINASFLGAFDESEQNAVGVGSEEVIKRPRHVSQIMSGFLAQVHAGNVSSVIWSGQGFKVMPFIDGGSVDVECAKREFTYWDSGIRRGEVYLHYAPPLGRVLVSVDGTHFIGCIGVTRTMDALEMIAKGNSGTIRTTGYVNSTGKSVMVGAV